MIDGELHTLAVLEDIGAAVADVAEDELVPIEGGNNCSGSHSSICWELSVFPNIRIRGGDGKQKPGADGDIKDGSAGKTIHDGCHCAGACDSLLVRTQPISLRAETAMRSGAVSRPAVAGGVAAFIPGSSKKDGLGNDGSEDCGSGNAEARDQGARTGSGSAPSVVSAAALAGGADSEESPEGMPGGDSSFVNSSVMLSARIGQRLASYV